MGSETVALSFLITMSVRLGLMGLAEFRSSLSKTSETTQTVRQAEFSTQNLTTKHRVKSSE